MLRILLLALVFLTCFASAAAAQSGGTNLTWNQCRPDGGVMARHIACDTNEGTNVMVASFDPGVDIPEVKSFTGIIDLCTGGVPLPDWWQFFQAGTCRQSALTASADFTSWPGVACLDPWSGAATGGVVVYEIAHAWEMDAARIKVLYLVDPPVPVEAGNEYFGFRVAISNAKTVGTDACTGCQVAACIVLNELRLVASDESDVRLTLPLQDYYITWQDRFEGCPFVVAAKNRTWGSVKALYR